MSTLLGVTDTRPDQTDGPAVEARDRSLSDNRWWRVESGASISVEEPRSRDARDHEEELPFHAPIRSSEASKWYLAFRITDRR
jgi:hypothetical protein